MHRRARTKNLFVGPSKNGLRGDSSSRARSSIALPSSFATSAAAAQLLPAQADHLPVGGALRRVGLELRHRLRDLRVAARRDDDRRPARRRRSADSSPSPVFAPVISTVFPAIEPAAGT